MYPAIVKNKHYIQGNVQSVVLITAKYNPRDWKCYIENKTVEVPRLYSAVNKGMIYPVNFVAKSNGQVAVNKYDNSYVFVSKIAHKLRAMLEKMYGKETQLAGHCIEASSYLETFLRLYGFKNIRQVEGWCLFDDEYYGSDRPYDEHTWLEFYIGKQLHYLDITADQFNVAMYSDNRFNGIEFRKDKPKAMRYVQPVEGVDYWIDC